MPGFGGSGTAYSKASHIPRPFAGAAPSSLKAHPLCLQYAELPSPSLSHHHPPHPSAITTLPLPQPSPSTIFLLLTKSVPQLRPGRCCCSSGNKLATFYSAPVQQSSLPQHATIVRTEQPLLPHSARHGKKGQK